MQNSGTTIELDNDAKASLEKEMKGKDYDLEGIESRLSKRTHHTNMTGKTGITSNRSVTTQKYALHFSQQKKYLNEEQKNLQLWSSDVSQFSVRYEYVLLARLAKARR